MSDNELANKRAYFEAQELLDISDDETNFPDAGLSEATRVLASSEETEAETRPAPAFPRKTYGFLGPTPRQRQAEFEAQAAKQRAISRAAAQGLVRSATAPEPVQPSSSFPVPKRKHTTSSKSITHFGLLKHINSLPGLTAPIEFYKRVGAVPRPLSKAKKDAVIKLEPEHRQYLKGKIICMVLIYISYSFTNRYIRFLSQ